MRALKPHVIGLLLLALVAASGVMSFLKSRQERASDFGDSCGEILHACEKAGYQMESGPQVKEPVQEGHRLFKDCYEPVVLQKRSVHGVSVDPQKVEACSHEEKQDI